MSEAVIADWIDAVLKIFNLRADVTPSFSPSYGHKQISFNIKQLLIFAFSGMSGKSPFPFIPA